MQAAAAASTPARPATDTQRRVKKPATRTGKATAAKPAPVTAAKKAAAANTAGTTAASAKKTATKRSRTTKKRTSLPVIPTPAPVATLGRIPIMHVTPQIEGGSIPAKGTEHEAFPVQATVWREGHDLFGCEAVLVDPNGAEAQRAPMKLVGEGVGRYEGWLTPGYPGDWQFFVRSWSDPVATWRRNAEARMSANQDTELVMLEARQLLERVTKLVEKGSEDAAILEDTLAVVDRQHISSQVRFEAVTAPAIQDIFARHPLRELVTESGRFPVRVERLRALEGAWYEIFPRSAGARLGADGTPIPGTLRTATKELDRIAGMGFDVVYLTPVNPIGTTARKGKNNALTAGPGDPGSPYAIGSADGGHDAIDPGLGTVADFEAFTARAHELGLEVALDFALQCSPDHPWLTEHPDWFVHRADGTIAYAENPPKKYQDIYPLYFDKDPEGLYREIVRILEVWIDRGVTIFRVDNPHTKPVPFWQRLIDEFHRTHPNIVFLAEALSSPQMLLGLGAAGFSLSYCYFPWRTEKKELEDYLWEVSRETDDRMRPMFWPVTPDVLTPYMMDGGAPAYRIRAVLAATGAPTFGIYSGFELVENTPRPGFEEPNDNEKYEIKVRDFSRDPYGLTALLTRLNAIRKAHPALRRLRGLHINPTTNPSIISYTRLARPEESPDGKPDAVIVVVNLDPHNVQEASIELDTAALGVSEFTVRDALTGSTYRWNATPFVRLDPTRPAHIMEVSA